MGRPWPLVGRDAELGFVLQAMERPGVRGVVVAGPPGVGKSRLVTEALAAAGERGRATAWAAATRSARQIPLGALAPLLPHPLPGEVSRVGVLRAAGEALARRGAGAPLVLGIDDAHLLDDASAALVHQLASSGGGFVVASILVAEQAPDAIVALWKDGIAERLELQPLSRQEAAELVGTVLGEPLDGVAEGHLWTLTRGNVLFLREVILTALEDRTLVRDGEVWRWRGQLTAAPRLVEVIEARLGGLGSAQRRALEVAAIGEPLGLALLRDLSSRRAVEELERRGLLEERLDGRRIDVRPAHPMYGEVLRKTIPPGRSRAVHRALAERLETTGARRREDLLRLATWRLSAGLEGRPDLLAAAARKALWFDPELAGRLAAAARESEGGSEAALALAEAMIGRARFEEAEHLLADLERSAATEPERCRATVVRSHNLFWRLGRGPEAEAHVRSRLAETSDPEASDALGAAHATFLLFLGRTEAAMEEARAVLERAGTGGGAAAEAAMAASWGLTISGRTREAVALIERVRGSAAVEEVPQAGDWLDATLAIALALEGRPDEGEALALAAHRTSVDRRTDFSRGIHAFALGWITALQGRMRTAAAWFREAEAALEEVDIYQHRPATLGGLAYVEGVLGNAGSAEVACSRAEATGVPWFRMDEWCIGLGRMGVALARGEISAARSHALWVAEVTGSMGQRTLQLWGLHEALRLGVRQVAPELAAVAQGVDGELARARGEHAAALEAGDPEALARASARLEAAGALLLAAEAAAEAARGFREAGRRGSAFAAATRARALADRCEGVRTPALEGVEVHFPLTEREREVAGLAARGLSSREIAERLVLSIRTVDNHLRSVYAKLGIRGRRDLAAVLDPARVDRG